MRHLLLQQKTESNLKIYKNITSLLKPNGINDSIAYLPPVIFIPDDKLVSCVSMTTYTQSKPFGFLITTGLENGSQNVLSIQLLHSSR